MPQPPKISIIIPVYNVESYIADCLQSVMRQTYAGPMECVLVDDCGKDRSIEIAEKLIEDYTIANQKSKIKNPISFRIIHHDHNRGVSAARNTGTDAATGDYIYYVDSDDYISDECIEVLTNPLKNYDYDIVIGDVQTLGDGRFTSPIKKTCIIYSQQEILSSFFVDVSLYCAPWNKLIKRNLFRLNDMTFVEGQKIGEDMLWTYKCCACVKSLFVQKVVTYHYVVREESAIGTMNKDKTMRIRDAYISADYVLSNPILVAVDLWNIVAAKFLITYVALTDGQSKYKEEYLSLRKKFNYQPLKAWYRGEITLIDVKHFFYLVLPPRLGFCFVKIRHTKNHIIALGK